MSPSVMYKAYAHSLHHERQIVEIKTVCKRNASKMTAVHRVQLTINAIEIIDASSILMQNAYISLKLFRRFLERHLSLTRFI